MKHWPTLYDLSSKGKIKQWTICVDTLYKEVAIFTSHGYQGGKVSTSEKVIHKGKNIGKKNETTPYQQACLQAQSKYDKQLKKGYVDNVLNIGKSFSYLPMLAKTYYQSTHPDVLSGKKKKTELSFPRIVQRKLNGVRSPAIKSKGKVKLYTREGNEYTTVCSHIANALNTMMVNGDKWDGEIYVHGWSFQRIIRAVKKDRLLSFHDDIKKALGKRKHTKEQKIKNIKRIVRCKHDTQKLQYHRYDICDENARMEDRMHDMYTLPTNDIIVQVISEVIFNVEDLKHFHDYWVRDGYEGLIIRDPDAVYRWKYRGASLYKYKEFTDAEFRIVGYKDGEGSDSGCITFKCRTPDVNKDGSRSYFDVRPRGTVERRRAMYNRGWAYVGKMLTVRFQELSEDGIPIFPVGIIVRDYE
jgi:hypothetical protein